MLHKTLGVNPRMTFCTNCGNDAEELAMLGNRNFKAECTNCNVTNYGSRSGDVCGKCKQRITGKTIELTEFERVPASQPCQACMKCFEECAAGGVLFNCEAGCFGCIPRGETANQIRTENEQPAPAMLGVSFSADNCPNRNAHKPQ